MTPASTTVLERERARIYVREIGSGRPIVILHGGPDFNHDYLVPELDGLADIGRLVYYDQRGRGRSYAGEGPDDVSLESEMDDLDRVREWTGAESVVLLGHSWGALLALEYAIRFPAHVWRLVLINAAPASHSDLLALRQHLDEIRGPELVGQMRGIRDGAAYRVGDLGADAAFYRLHFRGAVRRPEHLEQIIARLRLGFTPDAIVAARAIEERLYEETWLRESYDLRPALSRLRIPTLALHGDHDLIPIEIARHIADAIPTGELRTLRDCGHFAYLEQPEAVQSAVAQLFGD
ncbi:MAG: alpha/beta fold hydrolase [Chloroflexota bacterium]|nr:alpha/beta fold hydrolase [Chloroflexota bacterium]